MIKKDRITCTDVKIEIVMLSHIAIGFLALQILHD